MGWAHTQGLGESSFTFRAGLLTASCWLHVGSAASGCRWGLMMLRALCRYAAILLCTDSRQAGPGLALKTYKQDGWTNGWMGG